MTAVPSATVILLLLIYASSIQNLNVHISISGLDQENSAGDPMLFGDRYSVLLACILAMVSVTPFFVIASICICWQYRQKLRCLRTVEQIPSKYLQQGEPEIQSAHSSLAVPLTISTNAGGNSPQIFLEKGSVVFGGRDSIHQSLLFDSKTSESPPLAPMRSWRLNASYTCLASSQNAPASEQNSNPVYEDSSLTKSPLSVAISDQKTEAKFEQNSQASVHEVVVKNGSGPASNSSPQLVRVDPQILVETPHLAKRPWRPRLRRSSTQTRTHFFPHAWKPMISKSAAGTPLPDTEATPFFNENDTPTHKQAIAEEIP